MAAADETFTIAPPPDSAMSRAALRQHSRYPRRFTSTTRRRSSVRASASGPSGPVTPALLTRPVTVPSSAPAMSKSRSTAHSSAVSTRTVTHRAPAARTRPATASADASSRT
ncbi:hypothetical protein ADK92_12300 [Streptomyces sp. XY533]|nr:hypothetical protein ADK92_12300 [Streptomyces sp. XY533]